MNDPTIEPEYSDFYGVTTAPARGRLKVWLFVLFALILLVSLLMALCAGFLHKFFTVGIGEDSMKHYAWGGFYSSRTPSMSPDGSVIAFSSPRSGNGDIYEVKSDGSGMIRLTSDAGFETDPLFSPDGSIVAFTREAGGRRHVWLMDRDGNNQRRLTSGDVLDDLKSFTHDGSELLIMRSALPTGMGRVVEVFAVNIQNKDVRKLDGLPEYSPDGKQIAFSKYILGNQRYEIWVMDADGGNKRVLAEGVSPHFSPDGETILYSSGSTYSGPGSLWKMMAVDGSTGRELGQMHEALFARDGKHIVYVSPSWRRELWKMDLDGTNRTRLETPVGYYDYLRPCRSGFILKVVTDDRVGDIYLIDTDTWKVSQVAAMK
jgi:Tol biopolymer transport system component